MSFVSSIFILVPVVAPAFGQAVLLVASWRMIFWLLVLAALLDGLWFGFRQPETLPPERRNPLSIATVARGASEVLRHPITLGYTLGTGFVFGAFINYLSTSQQVFQEQYGIGKLFPLFFGSLAAAIGLASVTNAKLVMRFGMLRLARLAVGIECVIATLFLSIAVLLGGHPPLGVFMAGMFVCFFCNGILFGNYNARALEPMGHIAGIAAAITGCLSSLVGIAFGTPLGRIYDGTVSPIIAGFMLASFVALICTELAEYRQSRAPRDAEPAASRPTQAS